MFKSYLKIAWRNLLKNKGFTFINVAGLTIGMASAALILFWINHEVGYDQFHEKKDRLYTMYNKAVFDGKLWCWNTTPKVMAKTLREYPQVEDATHTTFCGFLFTVGDKKLNAPGYFTDSSFLKMFTFPVVKGDPKTALNNIYSIVLTEKLAKKLYGNNDAVGKVLRIDSNANFTVTAVIKDLPDNSRFKFEYLLPWQYMKKIGGDDEYWGNNSVQTYALLKPGVTEQAANKQIKNITKSHSDQKDTEVFLHPISKWRLYSNFDEKGNVDGGRISTIRLFGIIAAFILVIACINFMNLSTARSEKRAKEVGIRKVAGAQRGLLIGQFLSESIIIALIAGILALVIVYISLPAFNNLTDKVLIIPYADPYFWLLFFGFIILTGVIAGSYPAFYLSSFNPVKVLKGTFKAANALVTPRKVLVVMQFTFAIVLIICTIVVKNQLEHAQNRDTGYNRSNLAYTFIAGEIDKHYKSIRDELMSSGAVTGVTKTSAPITEGWSDSWGYSWPGKDPNAKLDFNVFTTDGELVKTIGLKIIAGRDIDVHNYPTDTTAMLLNEAAVKVMGFKDAVGQIVDQDGGHKWHVVGVIKDFVLQSPYDPVKPMVIQGPNSWFNIIHYKLNSAHSTADNLKRIGAIFKKFNPEYPFEYKFADEQYALKFKDEQRTGTLATLFAGLTIFISCLGLFGLATYMAQNRVKEIGVRKVLGASVARITTLLSTDFLILVLISFVIATPIAWWGMSEWLKTYTYRIDISIWVFVIAGLLTILIAITTISFQTIKAAIANPVKSLRSE